MKILQILKDCVTAAVKTDKLLFSKTDEDGYMLMSPQPRVIQASAGERTIHI